MTLSCLVDSNSFNFIMFDLGWLCVLLFLLLSISIQLWLNLIENVFLFLNFFNSCNYSQILCLKLSYLRKSYEDMHEKKLSEDPEEQKMYYYREDIMYHMFHSLLHSAIKNTESRSRNKEQFWYAHQQMMRRYVRV